MMIGYVYSSNVLHIITDSNVPAKSFYEVHLWSELWNKFVFILTSYMLITALTFDMCRCGSANVTPAWY